MYRAFRPLALLLTAATAATCPAQESVMVMEAFSGKVLAASNSGMKRPVASLTKIATGAVATDWAQASGADIASVRVTIPQTAALVGGPNPLNLQPGEQMTLRDALYAALLASDNIAALAIGDHVGSALLRARGKGGEPLVEFVGEMNRLAKGLGMSSTRFANPHGLERPGTKAFSTAADMARLSVHAMRRNSFSFIARQPERRITIQGNSGPRNAVLRNTNELVGDEGVLGIKTGTTAAAGACLALCVERNPLVRLKPDGTKGATPRRLIVVVLGNPDRFERARQLARQGWNTYDPWLAAGAPVKDRRREIIDVPDPG